MRSTEEHLWCQHLDARRNSPWPRSYTSSWYWYMLCCQCLGSLMNKQCYKYPQKMSTQCHYTVKDPSMQGPIPKMQYAMWCKYHHKCYRYKLTFRYLDHHHLLQAYSSHPPMPVYYQCCVWPQRMVQVQAPLSTPSWESVDASLLSDTLLCWVCQVKFVCMVYVHLVSPVTYWLKCSPNHRFVLFYAVSRRVSHEISVTQDVSATP